MNRKKNNKGSITLEASLVLPIFIFLLLFMYGIIMVFSGKELMSHAALESAQSLSLDSFANEKIGGPGFENSKTMVNQLYSSLLTDSKNGSHFSSNDKWYSGNVSGAVESRFWGYFIGGSSSKANKLLPMIGIKEGTSGVRFSSSYKDGDNNLHIIVEYDQQFMFDMGGTLSFPRRVEVVSHMWGLD